MVQIVFGSSRTFTTANGKTLFSGINDTETRAGDSDFATEANSEINCRVAGTFTDLYTTLDTNSTNFTTTVTLRKNGADTALTISISSSTTGDFSDTGESISISDGDTVTTEFTYGAGSGSLGFTFIDYIFEPSSGSAKQITSSGDVNYNTASTTRYNAICGGRTTGTLNDGQAKVTFCVATTVTDFQAYVRTNGRSTTSTVDLEVNSTAVNNSVSISSSSTGMFEDTSSSDSIAIDDEATFAITVGSGTGDFIVTTKTLTHTTDGAGFPFYSGDNFNFASATRYIPLAGDNEYSSTEDRIGNVLPVAMDGEDMTTYVYTNSSTTTTTTQIRKNNANGTQSISISAASTGGFRDSSGTDSFSADDQVNYIMSGQDANVQLGGFGMFMTIAAVGGADTYYGCIGLVGYA